MQELYTPQEVAAVEKQKKEVLWHMGIFAAGMLALIALSFWQRWQPVTVLLTILLGAGLIFWWDMKLRPVMAYRRFLGEMAEGLSRETEGVLVLLEEEPSYREGRRSYRMLLNVDEKMDPEGERQFFLDANKPRPDIVPGQRIRVRHQGNDVLAWGR